MNQQKIGKFIAERRKEKELTQVELADKLGVSNRTISKWENGNSLPDYSMFNDLCNELDISINELLSGEKLTEENYQKKLEENIVGTIDYNNKKRNQKIKKCIVNILSLVIIYLLYKSLLVCFFYKDYTNTDEKAFPYNKNISTIKINSNTKANTKVFRDFNIYIPNDYKLVTDKAKSSLVMDGCNPYFKNLENDATFDSVILVCEIYHNDLMNLDYHGISRTFFPWFDPIALLEKYHIEDPIDLIKYHEKHYNFKQNIFSSSDDIKMNFIARQYATMTVPSYDYFYYLENDLRGYLIDNTNKKTNVMHQQATIVFNEESYNSRIYSVSFWNNKENDFNHENSIEILESIYRD